MKPAGWHHTEESIAKMSSLAKERGSGGPLFQGHKHTETSKAKIAQTLKDKGRLLLPCKKCGVVDRYARGDCKPCARRISREYYRNNQDKVKTWAQTKGVLSSRKSRLKSKYGLTLEAYETMLSQQGNACKLCKKIQERRPLNVDHSHSNGIIRGLLCDRCNLALGFMESIGWTLRATEYLQTNGKIQ